MGKKRGRKRKIPDSPCDAFPADVGQCRRRSSRLRNTSPPRTSTLRGSEVKKLRQKPYNKWHPTEKDPKVVDERFWTSVQQDLFSAYKKEKNIIRDHFYIEKWEAMNMAATYDIEQKFTCIEGLNNLLIDAKSYDIELILQFYATLWIPKDRSSIHFMFKNKVEVLTRNDIAKALGVSHEKMNGERIHNLAFPNVVPPRRPQGKSGCLPPLDEIRKFYRSPHMGEFRSDASQLEPNVKFALAAIRKTLFARHGRGKKISIMLQWILWYFMDKKQFDLIDFLICEMEECIMEDVTWKLGLAPYLCYIFYKHDLMTQKEWESLPQKIKPYHPLPPTDPRVGVKLQNPSHGDAQFDYEEEDEVENDGEEGDTSVPLQEPLEEEAPPEEEEGEAVPLEEEAPPEEEEGEAVPLEEEAHRATNDDLLEILSGMKRLHHDMSKFLHMSQQRKRKDVLLICMNIMKEPIDLIEELINELNPPHDQRGDDFALNNVFTPSPSHNLSYMEEMPLAWIAPCDNWSPNPTTYNVTLNPFDVSTPSLAVHDMNWKWPNHSQIVLSSSMKEIISEKILHDQDHEHCIKAQWDFYGTKEISIPNFCLNSSFDLVRNEIGCRTAQLKECGSLVVVGDENQLPPMVMSGVAKEANIGGSFHIVGQYKMHPSISHFPNARFYDNQILDAPLAQQGYGRRFLPNSMYGPYSASMEILNFGSQRKGKVGVAANIVERLAKGEIMNNPSYKYLMMQIEDDSHVTKQKDSSQGSSPQIIMHRDLSIATPCVEVHNIDEEKAQGYLLKEGGVEITSPQKQKEHVDHSPFTEQKEASSLDTIPVVEGSLKECRPHDEGQERMKNEIPKLQSSDHTIKEVLVYARRGFMTNKDAKCDQTRSANTKPEQVSKVKVPENVKKRKGRAAGGKVSKKVDTKDAASVTPTKSTKTKFKVIKSNAPCLATPESSVMEKAPKKRVNAEDGKRPIVRRKLNLTNDSIIPFDIHDHGENSYSLRPLRKRQYVYDDGSDDEHKVNSKTPFKEVKVSFDDMISKWETNGVLTIEDNPIVELEEKRKDFKIKASHFMEKVCPVIGPRNVSRWKGSVILSVVGALLTQNAKDDMTSIGIMKLMAKFSSSKCSNAHHGEPSGADMELEELMMAFREGELVNWDNDRIYSVLFRRFGEKTAEVILTDIKYVLTTDTSSCKRLFDTAHKNGYKSDTSKMDWVDWEAVMNAPFIDLEECIREGGQQSKLTFRVMAFLIRMKRDHGHFDLEWLRSIPSELAREYLSSIRGLGHKTVDCISLLTLRVAAFPVDVNVSRLVTRLEWVPLVPRDPSIKSPPPNALREYLLPIIRTTEPNYLWELHNQGITFGKTICTSNPKCGSCPLKPECKHYENTQKNKERSSTTQPDENLHTDIEDIRTDIGTKTYTACLLSDEDIDSGKFGEFGERSCGDQNPYLFMLRTRSTHNIKGTILIPSRTANKGTFPLDGTYFQPKEVFADHSSTVKPIPITRSHYDSLPKTTVYCGASISSITMGKTKEQLSKIFEGFICTKGFHVTTRWPCLLPTQIYATNEKNKTKAKNKKNEISGTNVKNKN